MMDLNGTSLSHPKVPGYIYELCRRFRKNQTKAEEILWDCLRARRLLCLKFRRQHPFGRYIADFYCPEKQLVIELEGAVHGLEDQREYDKARKDAIEALGLRVLYFSNDKIFNHLEEVLTSITSPPESPSPLAERGDEGVR